MYKPEYILNTTESGFAYSIWHDCILSNNLNITLVKSWNVSDDDVNYFGNSIFSEFMDGRKIYVFELESGKSYSYIRKEENHISIHMACHREAEAEYWMDKYRELFPLYENSNDSMQLVGFWAFSAPDPMYYIRKLEVPTWPQVRANYPNSVAASIDRLAEFKPSKSGQLIIFHGPPGTGKTWVLRSLIHRWKDWASFDVVTDCDDFFGQSRYMTNVLLHGQDNKDKWRIFILEDAGELLSADANSRVGQSLARFLNLTDGLIGQGLKIMIIVTANEELDRLHPAVTRIGRCAAKIYFGEFSQEEARIWVNGRAELNGERSLAELYNLVDGNKVIVSQPKRKAGFLS